MAKKPDRPKPSTKPIRPVRPVKPIKEPVTRPLPPLTTR